MSTNDVSRFVAAQGAWVVHKELDTVAETQVAVGAAVEVAAAVEVVVDEGEGAGHRSGVAATKLMRLWSQPQQLQTLGRQSAESRLG